MGAVERETLEPLLADGPLPRFAMRTAVVFAWCAGRSAQKNRLEWTPAILQSIHCKTLLSVDPQLPTGYALYRLVGQSG